MSDHLWTRARALDFVSGGDLVDTQYTGRNRPLDGVLVSVVDRLQK